MTRQLVTALIGVFVSAVGAQAESQAESGHVAKVLIALENVWVEALVQADTAKLEAILVDTYVDTDEGGHQSDKSGTLAVLKSGDRKFKTIKLSNMKVYTYGDVAIVTGLAAQDGTFKGDPVEPNIVFTDTFVLQKGIWKAAASHRTRASK